MEQVSTVGLDLAKNLFQAHGADASGEVVFRKKLSRGRLLAFFAGLSPCVVAMEASAGEAGSPPRRQCSDAASYNLDPGLRRDERVGIG